MPWDVHEVTQSTRRPWEVGSRREPRSRSRSLTTVLYIFIHCRTRDQFEPRMFPCIQELHGSWDLICLALSCIQQEGTCSQAYRLPTPCVALTPLLPSTYVASSPQLVPTHWWDGEHKQLDSGRRGLVSPSGSSGSVLSWRGGIQECAGLRPSWGWSCDQLPLPVKPKAGRSSAHLARGSPKAGG